MKSLNFFGQFFGALGIPIHSRYFAEALIDNLENVNLVQLLPNDNDLFGITNKIKNNFKNPNIDYENLAFWYPNTYSQIFKNDFKGKKLGYYIFEYTKIPKQFIDEINKLDGICTASKWGTEILKNNGVNIPCYVVPGGVDSNVFNSKNRKLDSQFKFLHIGKAENRKSTDLVIRSFLKAFQGDRNIKLSLFIDNPHINNFDAEKYVYEITKDLPYALNGIKVCHFFYDITSIYNSHHCGIFPTKAEGIGLPIVESMACGLPVITSFNTGITEYANDDNSILLKQFTDEEIYDPKFFPNKGEFGTWKSPSEEELIEKMKWIYSNYEQAKVIGFNAEKYMKEKYSWDLSAKSFVNLI
jgi:hypothetical protein